MGVPFSNEIFQYAVPGGQIVLAAQFQTYAGSGFEQAVSSPNITITSVSSGAVVVATTSTGIIAADSATFNYTWQPATTVAPGDYTVLWSATGPSGTLTLSQTVTISAPPSQTPGPGVYATVAQYQAWSGDTITPTSLVTPALRRCSEIIDLYVIGAVYATDPDGLPTDASTIDAFMRATCAQCAYELAVNDPAKIKTQYASTSMGGVAQTRASGAQNQIMPPLAPQAAAIMRMTGILPSAPLVSW